MKLIHFVCNHAEIQGMPEGHAALVESWRASETDEVRIADDPKEADFLLFLEAGYRRFKIWEPNRLLKHPLVRRNPQKCYIWTWEDHPLTYLPGLYSSMEAWNFDPVLHRAFRPMTFMTEGMPLAHAEKRDLLYSFIGAPTAPLRKAIYSLRHPANAMVIQKPNFNHDRRPGRCELDDYLEVLARSQFVLCPRGAGVSSNRLYEVMRAGAVPVLLADGFVAPTGPRWDACSVKVAEKDVQHIVEVLNQVSDASQMGVTARQEFDRFFAADKMLTHIRRELEALGPADLPRARWHHNLVQLRRLHVRLKNRFKKICRRG